MTEFYELIQQGGWLMAPLGLCSLVALSIVIERAAALRRDKVIPPEIVRILHEFGNAGGATPSHSLAVCQRTHGAFARLAEELIQLRHLSHAQLLETMHAVGRTHVARLERGLTLLEIIAGISPLIGLLGTVLGMVTVFDAITQDGLGNPQVLAAGISQALVTTIAGLCVAIPALAFHGIYSKRVDELAIEMQERATAFLAKLHAPGT
ncbi:MAG: MotA/TolQ/ExbB proton channel family protein [Candidatus Hydrogenedentes bacterium]|nr:MotA/TolQ/ExbB proton channel family protein [Candidatus Hydrogenedentota bacterium]